MDLSSSDKPQKLSEEVPTPPTVKDKRKNIFLNGFGCTCSAEQKKPSHSTAVHHTPTGSSTGLKESVGAECQTSRSCSVFILKSERTLKAGIRNGKSSVIFYLTHKCKLFFMNALL